MSKPKGPCLDCADRTPGCHGSCEKYINYKAEMDAYNSLRIKELHDRYAAKAQFSHTKHSRYMQIAAKRPISRRRPK